MNGALAFALPHALEAREPPEARGMSRGAVRLLVASGHDARPTIEHRRFSELPELLTAGDLLVVNLSATLPAALQGLRRDGTSVRVHVSTRVADQDARWRVVELRTSDGFQPLRATPPETIVVTGGASLELVAPYLGAERLSVARFDREIEPLLSRHGRPIRYGYVEHDWPLEDYQNVYATTPGSAEMPSAGRPITERLIDHLADCGIQLAPITLHTGVSSPERHEAPYPEWFEVSEATARAVQAAKRARGRVIAVGTTVVRALESSGGAAGSGWTNLVITAERPPRVVDGLITGWHEPEASHLQMLEALAGREVIERSYEAALREGYLWHEFGDSHLILASHKQRR